MALQVPIATTYLILHDFLRSDLLNWLTEQYVFALFEIFLPLDPQGSLDDDH